MAKSNRESSVERAARALQQTVSQAGPVAAASYTLIGAIVLLGGLGYGLDAWLGIRPWGVVGGLVLGLIVGFYELARTVFRR